MTAPYNGTSRATVNASETGYIAKVFRGMVLDLQEHGEKSSTAQACPDESIDGCFRPVRPSIACPRKTPSRWVRDRLDESSDQIGDVSLLACCVVETRRGRPVFAIRGQGQVPVGEANREQGFPSSTASR